MIVHIPHGGLWRPTELSRFLFDDPAGITDIGARDVFEGGRGDCLVFPVDRLVCDVERLMEGEPMDAKGMGICYENDAMMRRFRIVDRGTRDAVIRDLYLPHHARLSAMVDEEIRLYGRCLVIDGHTFSPVPLPYEDDNLRPEICVGYDENVELGRLVSGMLSKWYDVMENRPFSGAVRPLSRIGDPRVGSVMIEVRQDLDMDDARQHVQEVMGEAEKSWYEGVSGYVPKDGEGRRRSDMFTEKERHEKLDALAKEYSQEPDSHSIIYSHWDEEGFDEGDYEELAGVISLYFVKDHGDWREGGSTK